MTRAALWAVVPVKTLREAKSRLSGVLAAEERFRLVTAMLEDVLVALAGARGLAGTLVVTCDAAAGDIARWGGARVLMASSDEGPNAAAALAARHLVASRAAGMLVVPADVPLATPAEIEAVLMAHGAAPAVTLVPALADGGSNAVACSPPGAIPFRFGRDSFARHLDAARASGIAPVTLRLPGLGHDVDRPEDLEALLSHPAATRTRSALVGSPPGGGGRSAA
jgi:2-phospho-L-lactate guanylyltransferase